MKITFGAFRGHFEVTLSISTSNFMCDSCVMHTCTGLVGPKRGKVKKLLVFKSIFEGVKGATGNLKPAAIERAEPFWGHFGNALASLWVYSGDFGLLSDCFGIIVELLWV